MPQYQVRKGYTVILGVGRNLPPGTVFEPSPEILTNQAWKIEPVKEAEEAEPMQEKPKPETKEVKKPPQDRAITPNESVTK